MTPFKERMNLYRAYREQNPDKNYWDWKASVEVPAMQDGGAIQTLWNGGPIMFLQSIKNGIKHFAKLNTSSKDAEEKDRTRYVNAMHDTSAGDLENVKSYIFDSNSDGSKDYTGSWVFDQHGNAKQVITGQVFKESQIEPNVSRDLVNNYVFGDDSGFVPDNSKPLVVDGEVWPTKQYQGEIIPYDTLFLPQYMQPTVDSLISEKKIYAQKNNINYSPQGSYTKQDYTLDNVTNHSGHFGMDENGYFTELFDRWDFSGNHTYSNVIDLFGINDALEESLKPTKNYPNAGQFVLRQKVPVVFTDTFDSNADSFINNLNYVYSNDASKRLKSAYRNAYRQ